MQTEYIAEFLHRGGRGKWTTMNGGQLDEKIKRELMAALDSVFERKNSYNPKFDMKTAIDTSSKANELQKTKKQENEELLKLRTVLNKTYHTWDAMVKRYKELVKQAGKIDLSQFNELKGKIGRMDAFIKKYNHIIKPDDDKVAIVNEFYDVIEKTRAQTLVINDVAKNLSDIKTINEKIDELEKNIATQKTREADTTPLLSQSHLSNE